MPDIPSTKQVQSREENVCVCVCVYVCACRTNVGCMWVRANARTFKLMVQVSEHLAKSPGWDQQVCERLRTN